MNNHAGLTLTRPTGTTFSHKRSIKLPQGKGCLYPASRVSFDLPRQIGKRKETLRAASRFFDPPLIRENG